MLYSPYFAICQRDNWLYFLCYCEKSKIYIKSPVYLFINLLTITLTIVGAYGVLIINKYWVMPHALLTTSVLGSFCVYTLMEAFFIR